MTTHTYGQCLRIGSPHLYPRADQTCGLWEMESTGDVGVVRAYIRARGEDATLGQIAKATKMTLKRVAQALDEIKAKRKGDN